MQLQIELLFLSNLLLFWLFPGICLVKILREAEHYPFGFQIASFVPILNFYVISQVLDKSFWKLFGILILLSFATRLLDHFWFDVTDNAWLYFAVSSVSYAVVPWYIWHQIAEKGGHPNPNLLGVLAGIPIIGFFAMPYIAWHGDWS